MAKMKIRMPQELRRLKSCPSRPPVLIVSALRIRHPDDRTGTTAIHLVRENMPRVRKRICFGIGPWSHWSALQAADSEVTGAESGSGSEITTGMAAPELKF